MFLTCKVWLGRFAAISRLPQVLMRNLLLKQPIEFQIHLFFRRDPQLSTAEFDGPNHNAVLKRRSAVLSRRSAVLEQYALELLSDVLKMLSDALKLLCDLANE